MITITKPRWPATVVAPPPKRSGSVEQAAAELAAGHAVVLLDDTGPAAEGELVIAGHYATTELIAFIVRFGSGFISVPMTAADCERLALPPMQTAWPCGRAPAYTVTVDARNGIGTGISATDRATTIRALADPSTRADDFTRPGHVVPLRANGTGVLSRADAAVQLLCIAELHPVAATCTIVSTADPTTMATADEVRQFGVRHRLATFSVTDLGTWHTERERTAFPTATVESSETLTKRRDYTTSRPDRKATARVTTPTA